MGNNLSERIRPLFSGEQRGTAAILARAALRMAEIPYSAAVRTRNALYHCSIFKSHRLARPVISVGNITTGGTGKTPVVRWLADNLRDVHPAILLRGYKSADHVSDEQVLLQQQLGDVPVIAKPSRSRGAAAALARQSNTGIFILDDGMQHRQIIRDFELVLIDATNPFGFGHMLPRGLLREPLAGLARAHAFLITRSDQVQPAELSSIQATLSLYHPTAPIYHANHAIASFRHGEERLPSESLRNKRLFLICGIGNPTSLHNQLAALNLTIVGSHIFPDHHSYTRKELSDLTAEISVARADLLITTEKDWTKIALLNHDIAKIICRTELSLTFHGGDEAKLLDLVRLSIARPSR